MRQTRKERLVIAAISVVLIGTVIACGLAFSRKTDTDGKGKAKRCSSTLYYLDALVESYRFHNHRYPSDLAQSGAEPFRFLCPATGQPYAYCVSGDGSTCFIFDSVPHKEGYYFISSADHRLLALNGDEFRQRTKTILPTPTR
jgi:hypothetical protein